MTDDDTDRYRHYVAAGHVEGKAAIQIRVAGSTGGTMHHNNPNGTCPYCLHQVPTLLPEGATLTVIPPPGATAPSPWWTAEPMTFVGNSRQPTPPSPEPPTR